MIILDGIVFSLQKYGGISNYFYNLNMELLKLNNDVKIITYNDIKREYDFPNNIKFDKRFLERYRNINLNSFSKNIVHSSYFRSPSGKKNFSVITVYDFIYEKHSNNFLKSKIHKFQKFKSISNADAIICISQNTKNDLLNYLPFINEKKVFVTHLACDDTFKFKMIPFELRINNLFVLFVGTRGPSKNFNSVVNAVKCISRLKLYIVGGGELTKDENKFLFESLKDRFVHFNYVDNDKLNDLYNNAICLLYPSLYEGFGIPILEAMSAGCPVITTNISSMPEVANNSALLIDIPTSENLVYKINFLLDTNNHNKIIKLGLANSKKFSWKKTALDTLNIYNSLI